MIEERQKLVTQSSRHSCSLISQICLLNCRRIRTQEQEKNNKKKKTAEIRHVYTQISSLWSDSPVTTNIYTET